jgi:uncharacterized membrane protein
MRTDPLDLPATSGRLRALAHHRYLSAATLERALAIAGHIPTVRAWRGFADTVLLLLGVALSLGGVFFFFAYNWADMSRFAKFGIIEAAILLAVAVAAYRGLGRLSGQVALLAAAVLVGALQAVFGQIYQTGADSYLLFLSWALLIAGWVAIGAYAPLWLLLLVLLNLSLSFYWSQVRGFDNTSLYLALAGLNSLWLLGWELARALGIGWLQARWTPRLIALATGVLLVVPTVQAIFASAYAWEQERALTFAPILYCIYTALVLFFYFRYQRDLFMLAAAALGAVVVVTSIGLKVIDFEAEGYIVLSALVVGQTALMVYALRRVARFWEATP